jgi:putative DNA methylase
MLMFHWPLPSCFRPRSGKEAYVHPLIEGGGYRFTVKVGKPEDPEKAKRGTKSGGSHSPFLCLMSGTPMPFEYLRSESKAGRMGARLMAIVAEGSRGRVYLALTPEHKAAVRNAKPVWKPEVEICHWPGRTNVVEYGLRRFGDLFTDRQLVALTTFSDLVGEAMQQAGRDAIEAGRPEDSTHLHDGGTGAAAYAEAVSTFLGLVVSGQSDRMSSICTWDAGGKTWGTKTRNTFARQAIPMSWDYAEVNPLSSQSGSYGNSLDYTSKGIQAVSGLAGHVSLQDAALQALSALKIVSTDPPYYDNIGYADLSDFFYVWLRRSLRVVFPGLFATLAVPKAEELVASPYRHGSKEQAETFFLKGMTQAMHQLAVQAHSGFPLSIYYAFKQAETKGKGAAGSASTGWETFLEAVMEAGLAISGTWPMRTELSNRMIGAGANALASSVVLVCQRRDPSAAILSRNAFRRELRQRLPRAIKELEHANIAPVDVAQAAIGPGMAIFSQAKAVLNPDDSPMSVREALIEINAALDEYLSEDEGFFDADTRFALTFFESYGYSERPYGDAEGLAVARNISVQGVAEAGVLSAIAGKVQLLRREQLDEDWDPSRDSRLCVWEATQHLIKALEAGGETAAAALMVQLKQLPGQIDLLANCKALAYRLYNHCEKTKQAEESRAYNGLVIAWQEIERQASNQPTETAVQASLI